MEEIELKVLDINPKKLSEKLNKIRAIKKESKLIIEKYFDFNDGSISKKDNMFRIRKVGDKVEINYKDGRVKDKDFLIFKEELETTINDFDIIERIIKKLGLKVIIHREKKRTSFIAGKIKIEVHEYPKIPAFAEFEGSKKYIKKLIERLGYNTNQTTSMTDTEIIKSYNVDYKKLTF
ncbi:MAG: CYTH domain-containing protein [Nanoarchaeota archaeon]|nr:CYTH domain-containing protein [Nanoarchaeota archaeon]